MVQVQTIRGPLGLDQLGETMMHEHVCVSQRRRRDELRGKAIAYATRKLRELEACGATSLVDVSPWAHRDMTAYVELASALKLNIITVSGFGHERGYQREPLLAQRDWSEDECTEYILKGLLEGVCGSNIRAGAIKVFSEKAQFTPWETKVFRAAGRAQRQTGVPICCHSIEGARTQFDTLVSAGADPERIYHSHVEAEFGWEGRTLCEEAKHLEAIAREGGSLYFNNVNLERDTPHEDMMYLMHYLCDKGYEHRVLFGIDANFHFDDKNQVWGEDEEKHPETGCRDYAWTYKGFIPLMRKWGFTDQDFRIMLVENPKRMFSTTCV